MITVIVDGSPTADIDDVTTVVTRQAAELSLGSLRDIWPVRTGRSRDGLRATDTAVVGAASYTSDVHQRGSALPIVDSDAKAIGEISAEQAAEHTDQAVSDLLDGLVTSILSDTLER